MFDFIGTSELKRFNSSQNEILVRRLQFSQTSKIACGEYLPSPPCVRFSGCVEPFCGFCGFSGRQFSLGFECVIHESGSSWSVCDYLSLRKFHPTNAFRFKVLNVWQ